jgi:nucleoside-diphosphate-sugar epimerase
LGEATRRVLISGATGFVGVNVARRMLERGHAVHALVRTSHRTWRLNDLAGNLILQPCDLNDPAALDRVFAAVRPEWVLHLAAYGGYETQTDVTRCVRTNLEATVNLIDAAARHGTARFVNTGSSSEYGFKDHPPDEDEPVEPNSLYAVTKAAATAYARLVGRSGRLSVTTLRLYSVYGPYEEPTRLIPTLILQGLEGRYPPLVDPEIARDFVYVDDVVDAYEAAASADVPAGAIYNIGSGKQTTLRSAVAAARTVFGIAEEPRWGTMADRKWDTTTWVANPKRAEAELGWSASTPFEDGFRRTSEWLSGSAARRSFYHATRTPPE